MMNTEIIKSNIDGILLLNKPSGLTSNNVLQKAKRLFGVKKAGHAGSLDPLATGMLPICFGEATKICHYLLHADKCYETTGLLGVKTDTADSTGSVIFQVDNFNLTEDQLINALSQHTGQIKQIPSMFSALKHQGTPLYHYARQGIEIERKARDILVRTLDLNRYDGREFELTVVCSKGTYIRNLVEDIGDLLQVGAHVTQLHRVYTSGFQNRRMYTLDELQELSIDEKKACLIPMDEAVDYFRAVFLTDDEVLTLRQGKIIENTNQAETDVCVRLYNEQSEFVGLGEQLMNGTIKAKRLLAF